VDVDYSIQTKLIELSEEDAVKFFKESSSLEEGDSSA